MDVCDEDVDELIELANFELAKGPPKIQLKLPTKLPTLISPNKVSPYFNDILSKQNVVNPASKTNPVPLIKPNQLNHVAHKPTAVVNHNSLIPKSTSSGETKRSPFRQDLVRKTQFSTLDSQNDFASHFRNFSKGSKAFAFQENMADIPSTEIPLSAPKSSPSSQLLTPQSSQNFPQTSNDHKAPQSNVQPIPSQPPYTPASSNPHPNYRNNTSNNTVSTQLITQPSQANQHIQPTPNYNNNRDPSSQSSQHNRPNNNTPLQTQSVNYTNSQRLTNNSFNSQPVKYRNTIPGFDQHQWHQTFSDLFLQVFQVPLRSNQSHPLSNNNNNNCKLTFQLVSHKNFSITVTGKKPVKKQFERIFAIIPSYQTSPPQANINFEEGVGYFELKYYNAIKPSFEGIPASVVSVTKDSFLPPWIIKNYLDSNLPPENPGQHIQLTRNLPITFLNQLHPFQKQGIAFGISKGGRCLIGDEMGLGKTIQAVGLLMYYRSEWPVLIVCPSSLRYQWAQQIETWIPDIDVSDIHIIQTGPSTKKYQEVNAAITIISYSLVFKFQPAYWKSKGYKIVICDESHSLKNSRTKTSLTVTPILKDAKHCILLTGTPAISRPEELFTQLNSIRPDFIPSWYVFALRYADAYYDNFNRLNSKGASNTTELNIVLKDFFMIRRLKDDVLSQLPKKTRSKIFIGLIEATKKQLNKIKIDMSETRKCAFKQQLEAGPSKLVDEKAEGLSLMMEYFHSTGTAKLPAVTEYLKELIDPTDVYEETHIPKTKYLIFGHHQDILDGIDKALSDKKVQTIRIDGKTPASKKNQLVNLFQSSDSNIQVAVLSMLACGTGLNLTAANVVIFTELWWCPGTLKQCEDRSHRMGQEKPVDVRYLVAKDTMDVVVWEMIEKKMGVLGEALNGKGDVMQIDNEVVENKDSEKLEAAVKNQEFLGELMEPLNKVQERKEMRMERREMRRNGIEPAPWDYWDNGPTAPRAYCVKTIKKQKPEDDCQEDGEDGLEEDGGGEVCQLCEERGHLADKCPMIEQYADQNEEEGVIEEKKVEIRVTGMKRKILEVEEEKVDTSKMSVKEKLERLQCKRPKVRSVML